MGQLLSSNFCLCVNSELTLSCFSSQVSNTYRGLVSIFATSGLGTMGFVQVAAAYNIPGMNKFTLANIMVGGVSCGEGENSCWTSLGVLLIMLIGGTANQFKVSSVSAE
jgi:hypothetical protein